MNFRLLHNIAAGVLKAFFHSHDHRHSVDLPISARGPSAGMLPESMFTSSLGTQSLPMLSSMLVAGRQGWQASDRLHVHAGQIFIEKLLPGEELPQHAPTVESFILFRKTNALECPP